MIKILLTIIFTFNALQAEENANITAIYMVSKNDDKIGHNATYEFDESVGYFDTWAIKPANSSKASGFSVVFYHPTDDSWLFKFAVPAGESLVKGKSYKNAESYPYQAPNKSGLKVCQIQHDFIDLRGEFTVLDYTVNAKGEVQSLAIDFHQVAGNKGELLGSLRYRSQVPLKIDFEPKPIDRHSDQLLKHYFEFFCEPGDYIGQGKHFITEDSFQPLHQDIRNQISLSTSGWILYLVAPNGRQLEKGVYLDAERWPFQQVSNPGISLFGNGRGCNRISGSFEILEIQYDATGRVEKLAIDFMQRCEGFMPPLRGTIRYNTHIRPSTEAEIKERLG